VLEERFVGRGEDAEHEGEEVADEVSGRARAEFVELVVARKALVQPDDRVFLRRVVVEEGAWRDVHATADLGDGRAIRPSFERELDGSAMDGVPRLPLFAGSQPLRFLHLSIIAWTANLRSAQKPGTNGPAKRPRGMPGGPWRPRGA